MLKGKQGRVRQNLLGKRVEYTGRSVIRQLPAINHETLKTLPTQGLVLWSDLERIPLIRPK